MAISAVASGASSAAQLLSAALSTRQQRPAGQCQLQPQIVFLNRRSKIRFYGKMANADYAEMESSAQTGHERRHES